VTLERGTGECGWGGELTLAGYWQGRGRRRCRGGSTSRAGGQKALAYSGSQTRQVGRLQGRQRVIDLGIAGESCVH